MKNKICKKCDCVNGFRATYCRKCNESLDDAQIVESKPVEEKKTAFKSSPRQGVRTPSLDNKEEQIQIPERPAKPNTIYWPFVLSLVSAMLMLGLIVAFVLSSGNDSGQPIIPHTSLNSGAVSSSDSQETQIPVTDMSEVRIGDIADQIYRAEPITIDFAISHNGVSLVEGEDYTVTYENNIGVGTANVYFEGTGTSFTGSFETTFNIVTGDSVCDDPENKPIDDFVIRLYGWMTGENPPLEVLVRDVGRLKNEDITPTELVNEVSFSDAVAARQMPDVDFMISFYYGVLGRDPDQAGLDYHLSLLAEGMPRQDIVNSIISAPGGEFEVMCEEMGLSPD